MVFEKLDTHMQKNETGPLPSSPLYFTIHKINYKLIKDLNVTPEGVKLLKEKNRERLSDIGLGNFSDMTQKTQP